MHSILFRIGSFPIHSYGVMLALSFVLGIWLATWRAKKANLDPQAIADLGFYVIFAAIIGARLYYVLLHFESFKDDLWSIVNPFQGGEIGIGGLVMYGGLIGAIIAGLIYFKAKKYPFAPYADACAPSVGLGIGITRIGCFLNGCCYGAPSSGFFSCDFPADSPAGYYQHHLHAAGLIPSQLIESAGGLVIAGVLLYLGRRKLFDGFLFLMLGILYAVLRFCVDLTRFYGPGERLGPLSHNQVVCIVMFVVFGAIVLKNVMAPKPPASSTTAPDVDPGRKQ